MAIQSVKVMVKRDNAGVSLYIQKADFKEMDDLKVGERLNLVYKEGDMTSVVITKDLGFDTQGVFAKLPGKETMVSTAKEKKDMPRAYCVSPCLGEVIRETLPISDEVGMYGIQ